MGEIELTGATLSRPKHARRKQARPGEILQAALDVFLEHGYAASRVSDIASRAGVTKGTVYLYFDDKERLFEAVVRETLGAMMLRGHALAQAFKGTAVELLSNVLAHWWNEIVLHEKISALPRLMIAEARNFPRLAQFYHGSVIAPARSLLKEVLERGVRSGEFRPVDVECTIHFIIAPFLYQQSMQHSLVPAVPGMMLGTENFLNAFTDHLLHALAARPV